ncbi:MAG: ABC transporter permease [Terriglobales bacterium]
MATAGPLMSLNLGFIFRQIRRSPGFAAVVILTLALGIGANTAIFSVVRAVLLAPLPFAQPQRLVAIGPGTYSFPDYQSLRRRSRSLNGMAAYVGDDVALTGRGRPREANEMITAGGIFHVLGVRPTLGRGFRRSDDRPGAAGGADAAVLSHRLWEEAFGGKPSALGQRIVLNGQDYAVVGVMPAGFAFPLGQREDVWTTVAPLRVGMAAPLKARGLRLFHLIGRRRAGASLGQVRAEMAGIAAHLARQYPAADAHLQINVLSVQQAIEGSAQHTLWLLFAAVGLVLLIACVNVSNLLLARGAGRRREMAVRAALGAGRGQLTRQLLAESAALGLLGGAAGLGLAALATDGLLRLAPHDVPRLAQAGISWGVLGFALAVGIATGVLFGWLPAAGLARADLRWALEAGGRGSSASRGQRRGRGVLVAAEFGLTLALLIAAGLLIRSLVRLQQVHPGFQPGHVLTAALSLPTVRYSPPQMSHFYDRLAASLEAEPGIVAAGSGHSAPLTGNPPYGVTVNWPLHPLPLAARPTVPFNVVTLDYFRALGVPRLRGRGFLVSDNAQSPEVILVNRAFTQRYLPGQNPVGRRLNVRFGAAKLKTEIVGEVGDVRRDSIRQPAAPMIYFTERQFFFFGDQTVVIRTIGPAAGAIAPLRAAVARLDPQLPVFAVQTMASLVAASLGRLRFATWLLGLFAALALLLATVGLYATMAQVADSRRREAGIRLALGAQRGQVLRLMVGQGMALAALGAGAGLVLAWAGTALLGSLLYGVSATDPAIFAAAAAVLLAVALAACYLPARHVARTDPAVALHED